MNDLDRFLAWLGEYWVSFMVGCWIALVAIAIIERSPGPLVLGAVATVGGRWLSTRER